MVFGSVAARPGRFLRALLGAGLLAAASGAAQAGIGLVWDLKQWSYTLAPDQTLELHATIYNEASATEHLLGSRFFAAYGEGIESAYDFLMPVQSLAEQFAAMDLAPGEGMDFVFGRLVPIGGLAAPGGYSGGGFSLAFLDAGGAEVSWTPEHSLHLDVVEGSPTEPGQALPEPGSLGLAAACLGALVLQRRRPVAG